MNILILEDEEPSAQSLQALLRQFDPSLRVLAVLPSIGRLREWLAAHDHPDLIFSDIELLDGNVFSYLPEARLRCPIIFATAYDLFMQHAFEHNGIGYLLKPVTYERLAAAMQKYQRLKATLNQPPPEVWEQLQKTLAGQQKLYKQRFAVKAKDGLILLPVEHISHIQADGGLIAAIDQRGKKHFLNETLQSLEELLDPAVFFRISRGSIVNVHYIEKIEPYFDDRLSVKLKGQEVALLSSISRTHLFRKWLE